MVATATAKSVVKEDVWITSNCALCYSKCPIRVHRVDGVVVKIEGNPDSPVNEGRICPRGASGIMQLYDPNRVNAPLKRTNPEKGLGVDPKFVEISWEEAMDTIVEKLTKLRETNPRGIINTTSVTAGGNQLNQLFLNMIAGMPSGWVSGAGPHCGNAEHLFGGMLHAAWCKMPDPNYCNYILNFGTPAGMGAYYTVSGFARKMADARRRGLKQVVIEPYMGMPSEKADEWIPIRPGTDAAMALAIANVLLNELGIYDAEYLRDHTNGPYLVGPDGYYVRDEETNKPLVWDSIDGCAKRYDDPTIKEMALEGTYAVFGQRELDGVRHKGTKETETEKGPNEGGSGVTSEGIAEDVRRIGPRGRLPVAPTNKGAATTGFSLLKEHVKKYTPESVAELTTVPAAVTRRLAKEFGENARIGSKIVIDGKELPYRPVAVLYFKGAQGHRNATLNGMAMELLVELVGASNVPGGLIGQNARSLGHPVTGRPYYTPSEGPDGLLMVGTWGGIQRLGKPGIEGAKSGRLPYPHDEARPPDSYTLQSMVPTAVVASPFPPLALLDPARYKLPYKMEMHLHFSGNYLMTTADPSLVAEAFKKLFTVSFSLFLDESTDLSDIVLPDTCYLERWDLQPDTFHNGLPVDEWANHLAQPAIEPLYERRPVAEVLLDLAERMGALPELNAMISMMFLEDPYKLAADKRYRFEEIIDRRLKSIFDGEHGVEWFREHGGAIRWPKRTEEVYWKQFVHARVPIYFESLKRVGDDVERVKKEHSIPDFDTWAFQPLPDWNPCSSHEEKRAEYDLWAFYFRVPFHTFTSTANNPWLDEIGRIDPHAHYIIINAATANRKGIRDEDWVELESSATGGKVKARARLIQGIHPEAVGLSGFGGRWARGLPIANQPGKGANMEQLLPLDFHNMDIPSFNQDLCAKVKISKLAAHVINNEKAPA